MLLLTPSSLGAAAQDKLQCWLWEAVVFLVGRKQEACAELCFGLCKTEREGVCVCLSLVCLSLTPSTVSALHRDCATKARASSRGVRLSWL